MAAKNRTKVVTIGGGSGTPVINQALLKAGVALIDSIVTVMDSGGVTGRMRIDSEGKKIAYSDGLRTLLSLIDKESATPKRISTLITILRSRNAKDQDLGYEFFSHFFDQETNGFSDIQSKLASLTGIKFKGRVIPVTLKSTNIVFKTKLGREYKGEHELDDKRMSTDTVKSMRLEPPVSAYKDALNAIKEAEFIFFSCGSLHGSVLCNLLPKGIKKAFLDSKAKKILVTNLVSTRNETHNFRPLDFVKVFRKYTGLFHPLDVLIVPKITQRDFESKHPKVALRYSSEHSYFLGWDEKELKKAEKEGVKIVTHSATHIEPKHLTVRHNPNRLSKTFKELIADFDSPRVKKSSR